MPFDFEFVHALGRTLGLIDYLSRHPSELKGGKIQAEILWNDWFTVNVVKNFKAVSVKGSTRAERSRKNESVNEKKKNVNQTQATVRQIVNEGQQPIRFEELVNKVTPTERVCEKIITAVSR